MHDTTPAANRGGHKTQPASDPREISLLEWDAARHAAGHPKPDLHKPAWPGEALRETAVQERMGKLNETPAISQAAGGK